jgi:flagellar basal-body rod protein FlgB
MTPTVDVLKSLFGPDLDNMQRAMSRTTQRHAMLVDNLANVNTPNYKRKDMDFSIKLEQEMGSGASHLNELQDEARQQDEDGTSMRVDGNNVDLEHEVMSLAETELHYQTLTDMAANYFSNMTNIIREGK